ncbi:MAG: glycosyltransferase family 2 protein [Ardenticatenaceae bacterium]
MSQTKLIFDRASQATTEAPSKTNRVALIPAYNEARFIGSVVIRAREYVDHVLVVNDGSSDATAEIARAAGAEVLNMPKNVGKAKAVTEGLRYVRRLRPTAVAMIDGDGQHNPEQIPNLLAPVEMGEADMVIGSRFIGIKSQIPKWRMVGQHTLTAVTNVTSGIYSTDSQSGFRAFSPQALPFMEFQAKGFSLESEMQFIAGENLLRVAEVPISVVYAEPPKRNPVSHGLQVLNGVLRLVGQMRPLFFFGTFGSLILIAGLMVGYAVLTNNLASPEQAVGYALICVLLSIVGIISLATGVILHSIRGLLIDWLQRNSNLELGEDVLG